MEFARMRCGLSCLSFKPGSTTHGLLAAWWRRIAFLLLALGWVTRLTTVALAQSVSSEVEPNDSPPTATPITLVNGFAIVGGALSPAADEDYFSFVAAPGARAWIFVDTGGVLNPNADSVDSILKLYEGNGTTLIEEDDDDGSGNGCDSTTETPNASAIGGRVLTAGGTYYLRVGEFADQGVIDPYRVYLVITTAAPVAEAENNGTPATANSIVTIAAPLGLRAGSIGAASDQDYYSVVAAAGSTLFVNADGDPERDGLGTDLMVNLYSTNGTTLLYSANSSAADGAAAESFCYTVPVAGTYYVRIASVGLSTGTYQLMVAGATGSTLQFTAALYAARENSGTATVAVTRSGILSSTVTVQFATSNGTALVGSDYTAVSRTLTFTNGVSTQFVSVPITNDGVVEGNETVLFRLSNPSGGAVLGGFNTAMLVILDDDDLNNTPATATPLNLSSGFAIVTNATGAVLPAISPPGDEDWYSFTAPAGAKVWAHVDTGGTQGPGATSRDSGLTLFAANGTTVIEEDDDDGSGNDCGPTLDPAEGKLASAIAGRALTAAGTYYLRVRAFDANQIIDPYKLFVVVTTIATLAEAEPNDTPGFANTLVTAATPIAERSARIAMANDVDIYSIVTPSNSLLYISADADPERDGTQTDLVLELLGTDGTTVLFSADSSGAETNAAEAFCFRLAQPGRYFVRVKDYSGTNTGNYNLMAARVPGEAEPNDDPANAAPLDLLSGFVLTAGAIAPGGDRDYYTFVSPPGFRVWLSVDTGGTQQPGANSRNSVLTLFSADGVTALEEDDNDGSGNGCDDTLESGDASTIAGRTLVSGGNYYVRVSASGGGIINPYKLFAMLTTTAPVAETEENGTANTANPIITAGSSVGLRSGAIGAPGDADFYSVVAVTGTALHLSADADPERDGIGTDLRLELLSTNGSTVLFSANSSTGGSMADPAAEAFCYVVPASGTYFVRVQHVNTGTGTYRLMVSRDRIEPPLTEVRIIALETIGADVRLSFESVAGRLYRVERTASLVRPIPWNTLPTVIPGNGGVATYLDVGATSQSPLFYRVRAEP